MTFIYGQVSRPKRRKVRIPKIKSCSFVCIYGVCFDCMFVCFQHVLYWFVPRVTTAPPQKTKQKQTNKQQQNNNNNNSNKNHKSVTFDFDCLFCFVFCLFVCLCVCLGFCFCFLFFVFLPLKCSTSWYLDIFIDHFLLDFNHEMSNERAKSTITNCVFLISTHLHVRLFSND